MAICIRKFVICASLWLGATSDAFVVHSVTRHNSLMIRPSTQTSEEVFNALGIEQEKLAVGVDPREFLNYIGT